MFFVFLMFFLVENIVNGVLVGDMEAWARACVYVPGCACLCVRWSCVPYVALLYRRGCL